MAARHRRRARDDAAHNDAAAVSDEPSPTHCGFCARPLGRRIEWHHLVPKSEGGRVTAPLHPICHRAIHAALPNKMLARQYPTLAALRGQEDLARFLAWIADKPPDFHAATRRRKR